MILRTITSLACTAILATAASRAIHAHAESNLRQALAKPPGDRQCHPRRQSRHDQLQLPSHARPQDHGRPGSLTTRLAHRRERATTLVTAGNLKIGTLNVPAGTYTLYTLPSATQWLLIINKQTGQWGTVYTEAQDLGRIADASEDPPLPTGEDVHLL